MLPPEMAALNAEPTAKPALQSSGQDARLYGRRDACRYAKCLPIIPMMRAKVISVADADAYDRPRTKYDYRGGAHKNWRGVNDDRRGLQANRRRRHVPGRGLIRVNGCRLYRTGDHSAGNHTRQNLSRGGPLTVTGGGALYATCQERRGNQCRNEWFHKISFVIPAYVHC